MKVTGAWQGNGPLAPHAPGLPSQFTTLLLLLLYQSAFKWPFTVMFMRHYASLLEAEAPFVSNLLDRLTVHLFNQPVRNLSKNVTLHQHI